MWVNEWNVAWSDDANAMVYTSSVNGEDVLDFPPSLDTLGRLRSLQELKLDRNQIRVLPPSLRELSQLTLLGSATTTCEASRGPREPEPPR